MRAGILILALLLPALLAGCIGGDDPNQEEVRQARAVIGQGTGGIEGVVTDVAIAALTGATVTLVELDITTETGDDGSFAFSEVPPGAYTLEATGTGFLPAAADVNVEEGAVAIVDFVLSPVVNQRPFEQVLELNGFVECSIGFQVLGIGNGIAVCAVPNGFGPIPENTTNDRFIHFYEFADTIGGARFEVSWNAGTFAEKMSYSSAPDAYAATPSMWLVRMVDTSPMIGLATTARIDLVQERLNANCENNTDSPACGMDLRLHGWPMASRLFAARDCVPAPASVCAPVQTAFQVLITMYHNQVVDESYAPDAILWNDGDP